MKRNQVTPPIDYENEFIQDNSFVALMCKSYTRPIMFLGTQQAMNIK